MLTASRARFLTTSARSTRFVEFADSAFVAGLEGAKKHDDSLDAVWKEHFQGSIYENDPEVFHDLAAETLVTRLVDAFQHYLADVLGWALWRRPEAADLLEQARLISASEGLELSSAVRIVATAHSEEASYGEFRKIIGTMQTKLGVSFPISDEDYVEVRRLIAVRNVAVHNQGRKNRRYCKDTPEPMSNIGQVAKLSLSEARTAGEKLDSLVTAVDETLQSELVNFGKPTDVDKPMQATNVQPAPDL
jgi:hypothetical protein